MSLSSWIYNSMQENGHHPGADHHLKLDAHDTQVHVVTKVDAVEIYLARAGRVQGFSVPPRTAINMAKWLLKWWARECWYGIRTRLFLWALSKRAKLPVPPPNR